MMKAASKAERPGYPHRTAHRTGIGQFRAGDQPQGRRLAGAIDAEQTIGAAGVEHGRNMIEDNFGMSFRPIELEDVVELDHGPEDSKESAIAAEL